ncbi:MAG: FG-GAP-like repeat-containing protein [Myxococcota bacterium]
MLLHSHLRRLALLCSFVGLQGCLTTNGTTNPPDDSNGTDAAVSGTDAAVGGNDAATGNPDAAVVAGDGGGQGVDASDRDAGSNVGNDAAVTGSDAGGTDGSVVVGSDAGVPDAGGGLDAAPGIDATPQNPFEEPAPVYVTVRGTVTLGKVSNPAVCNVPVVGWFAGLFGACSAPSDSTEGEYEVTVPAGKPHVIAVTGGTNYDEATGSAFEIGGDAGPVAALAEMPPGFALTKVNVGPVSHMAILASVNPQFPLTASTAGQLLSNNGGGIVSNNGGAIVSNNGGSFGRTTDGQLIANNGSNLVSNNGGSLWSGDMAKVVSNGGAGLIGDAGGGSGSGRGTGGGGGGAGPLGGASLEALDVPTGVLGVARAVIAAEAGIFNADGSVVDALLEDVCVLTDADLAGQHDPSSVCTKLGLLLAAFSQEAFNLGLDNPLQLVNALALDFLDGYFDGYTKGDKGFRIRVKLPNDVDLSPTAMSTDLEQAARDFLASSVNVSGLTADNFTEMLTAMLTLDYLPASAVPPLVVDGFTEPTATAGCVPIRYTLGQFSGRPVDVNVEYNDGTGTWRTATQAGVSRNSTYDGVPYHGTRNLKASHLLPGAAHAFMWNSTVDLPNGESLTGVQVRVRALMDQRVSEADVVLPVTFARAPGSECAPAAGGVLDFGSDFMPTDLEAADFDNDGRQDLVVLSGDDHNHFRVLWGHGDGRFDTEVFDLPGVNPLLVGVGGHPMAMKAADFTRDGVADLVVLHWAEGEFQSILHQFSIYSAVNGTLQLVDRFSVQKQVSAVDAADLDGDGVLDLIASSANGVEVQSGLQLLVFRGRESGGFTHPLELPLTNENDMAVGDVNGDGRAEIVMTTSGNEGARIYALENGGLVQYADPTATALQVTLLPTFIYYTTGGILLREVRTSGVYYYDSYYAQVEQVRVYRDCTAEGARDDYSENCPTDPTRYSIVHQAQVWPGETYRQLTAGWYDGDEYMDLAFISYGGNLLRLNGRYDEVVSLPISPDAQHLVTADFNGDGLTDVAISHRYGLLTIALSTPAGFVVQ